MGTKSTHVERWRFCGWSCDCCHDETTRDAPVLAPGASPALLATAEAERRRLAIAHAVEAQAEGI